MSQTRKNHAAKLNTRPKPEMQPAKEKRSHRSRASAISPHDLLIAREVVIMVTGMLRDLSRRDDYLRSLLAGENLTTPLERGLHQTLKRQMRIEKRRHTGKPQSGDRG